MGTHSSVLAWRIPGTEEPGGLPSMESHRVGHDWSDWAAAAAALTRQHSGTHVWLLNSSCFLNMGIGGGPSKPAAGERNASKLFKRWVLLCFDETCMEHLCLIQSLSYLLVSYWLHCICHKTIKERLVCKAVLDRVLRGFWNQAIAEWWLPVAWCRWDGPVPVWASPKLPGYLPR